MEKLLLRIVISILNHFHFRQEVGPETETETSDQRTLGPAPLAHVVADLLEPDDDDDDEEEGAVGGAGALQVPVKSVPALGKHIHAAIKIRFLPELTGYLTKKEGDHLSLRAPVAIAIVKLLLQLPQVPPLLLLY